MYRSRWPKKKKGKYGFCFRNYHTRKRMKYREYRIDNIRALAILLVVFGHSIIIYDPSWGVYTPKYESAILEIIKHYISLVQMPLFFSLSGYCFAISKEKNQGIRFLGKKAKRLLLPFFMVGILWMIPIRFISQYPFWIDKSAIKVFIQFILGVDSGHLWYLPTLFFIFVIFGATRSFYLGTKKYMYMTLIGATLLILSVLSPLFPKYFFIRFIAQYLWWFYIGYVIKDFASIVELLRAKNNVSILLLLISICVLSMIVFDIFTIKIIDIVLIYFGTSVFVLSCYLLISDQKNTTWSYLSQNSFGLYLFILLLYIWFFAT